MKYFFILLFVSAMHEIILAQNIIKGKVVDAASHRPLETASVIDIDSPSSKTITDQNGNFIIHTNSEKVNLIISYIGFKTDTISTGDNKEIEIELHPDVVNLKDVVVLQSNILFKFSSVAKIDLDLKPVRNTQELLRLIPGLFIAQHAGGGKAEQIFLRGFDCDHGTDIDVSVDGLPVNMVSHSHGQGYADSHFIIPETINIIDYGSGPYYTQHGNFNTAGYVSFSTYNNIPKNTLQVEGGLFNTFRTLAMIDIPTKNRDKQSAYLAGDFNYTNGPTVNKQNFNRFNVFGKYNLAISSQTHLTAWLSAFKSKWDASGQVPERAIVSGLIDRFGSIDPSEGGNSERYNANFLLSHKFHNGAVWENQAFYSRYKFNLYSDFTFFLHDSINGDEVNQAESRDVFGYVSKLNHRYDFGNWSLHSFYGVGIRDDATTDTKLAHVVKRAFLNDIMLGDIKEINAYGFIEQQANFGKWLLDAGVRFDCFHFSYFDKILDKQDPSQSKGIVSPKLNIQYTVNSQVQLFLKMGKGFHSNDTRAVVANEGNEILPAAYGSDIGMIVKPSNHLLVSVAAWYLYLQEEFVYDGDDGNIVASGKTRREGMDVILRYQLGKNLFANLNVNFTDPKKIGVARGQNFIPLAPTATSTGGLFYKQTRGFNGGLTYRYIGDRPANEDNSIVAKGYFLMDGSLNYTMPKFEVGIAFENMLNVKWNEAQFATESRLKGETNPVTELNFTPGTPLFARIKFAVFF